eukprot:350794-Chlamydomonas_euryale.AAC.2
MAGGGYALRAARASRKCGGHRDLTLKSQHPRFARSRPAVWTTGAAGCWSPCWSSCAQLAYESSLRCELQTSCRRRSAWLEPFRRSVAEPQARIHSRLRQLVRAAGGCLDRIHHCDTHACLFQLMHGCWKERQVWRA